MKSVWIAFVVLTAVTAQSAEIASIAFKQIEPILKEFVFAKPQYADLKTKFEEAGSFDPLSLIKADEKGNIVVGRDQLQQTSKMTSRFAVEKSVRDVMRREIVRLIESMNLKYVIVLNGDEEDALLYSRGEIEDITQKVYQELVKRLSEREPNQEKQLVK